MASYGMMWFRLFEEWSENKFVMHIFWDLYFQL
jgi:hypothetical protein